MSARAGALLAPLALAALAGLAIVQWASPLQWKPDSLFYEAHVYQIQGDSHAAAYRKVFEGPLSLPRREGDASLPLAQRRVGNPAWVRYSEQFYKRRWFVPGLAALLAPVWGTDALHVVSLIAYLLLGPLLYALLRLRATRSLSLLLASGALLLAPVLFNAGQPLTDIWGVTLETLAAAAALLVLERGRSWTPLWLVSIAALSLTRDSTSILVLAAIWIAVRERTRTAVLLAVSGALAAIPAPLLLGTPLRTEMAYVFSGFYKPGDSSWSWVAGHYWPNLRSLVRNNLTYLQDHPLTALFLVGGYLALFLIRSCGDRFARFFRAAAVGSILLDALLPNATSFRLELTFVPIAAAGLGLASTRVRRRLHPLLDTNVLRFGRGRAEGRGGGGAHGMVAADAPLSRASRPRRSVPHLRRLPALCAS